jgi:hypothetical protein
MFGGKTPTDPAFGINIFHGDLSMVGEHNSNFTMVFVGDISN